MGYSIFIGIMVIVCIVYMGFLMTSTNALIKTTPTSNDFINFKVLRMIAASKAKFVGMIILCIGMIGFAIGKLLNSPLSNIHFLSNGLIPLQDLMIFLLLLLSAGILYTQTKINHLFKNIDNIHVQVSNDMKRRITRYHTMNDRLFILFCLTLPIQIMMQSITLE